MTQQQSIYCPNSIFDNGVISIGEFKTMNDCMNYPIKDWCITREEDNKFDAYKRQGDRLLIICSWNRTDSQRFVVAIASRNHKIKYFDLNDLPMDLIAKTYEQSLGNDAISILKQYGITNESKTNKNMKKNIVKLNEQQLRQIVAESVKKVLKENSSDTDSEIYQAIASFMDEIHRIITTDREAVEYYGEEIRDVQQSAIRLRDALIHPTQRRMGVSQGDLTYDYLS